MEDMGFARIWQPVWAAAGPYLTVASLTAILTAALTWIGSRLIEARLKARFDGRLEDYKFEIRTRDQAAKIAEYAALALYLKATDGEDVYRRANQLSWELFLWLPDDVYRRLGKGLKGNPDDFAAALMAVRKILLGDKAGTLGGADMIFHRPNAGAKPTDVR